MTLIYVNGILIDIPIGLVIATEISGATSGDLTTRKVSHTNSIKLEWTPTNDIVFGFAKKIESISNIPYTKLPCKLVQNGIEIIPDGYCWVTVANENGFSISIYENAINVFDSLTGRKLNELNHISISAWGAAGIDAARLFTDDFIAAVLNWGRAGAIYQVDYFLPCWFYHSFVTESLKLTGLTLSGSVLTDTDFTDLVIPYSLPKFEYPLLDNELYQLTSPLAFPRAEFKATTTNGTDQEVTVTLNGGTTTVWQEIGDELELVDTGRGSGRWLTMSVTVTVGNIDVITWAPGDIVTVYFEVYHPTEGYTYQWQLTADEAILGASPVYGGMTLVTSATQAVVIGDGARIRCYISSITPTGIVLGDRSGFSDPLSFVGVSITTIDRTAVVWMKLVPDLLMTDIVKDFTIRFGVVYKQIGQTLYLKTLQEIIADRANAQDWSGKRVKGESISYQNSYAQRNTMKYQDEADDPNIGTGTFILENETLQQEKNLYTSPFGNAKTDTYSGGKKALVNVYENATTGITDFENEPGLRLLTLRAKEAGEGTITFNAIARSDYRVAYHVDPFQTKDAGFQYFINEWYDLLVVSLQKYKRVTAFYVLTEVDIINYDRHKMVYDNGAYYLVEKIVNFVPGRITKVELLKV